MVNKLENPEGGDQLKIEYRNRLANVLQEVHQFDGTEKSFQETMRKMIGLEKWLIEAFGKGEEQKRLSEELEKQIAVEMNAKEERTISGLLDLMKKRLEKVLRHAEVMEMVKLPGVLLKPGKLPIAEGQGEKVEEKEIIFQERLKKLILLLSQNGIYLDDLIVCQGELTETMRRQISYSLVEIPRINKEILVCDQVGEATFVIEGVLDREILMTLSKEELQEKYGEKVTKVIFRDEEIWGQGILAALRLEEGVGEKIDVRVEERLRVEIKKIVPTAESWVALPVDQRLKLRINGMAIIALARTLGIEGSPIRYKKVYLELGRKIYGENKLFEYEEFTELSEDQLIEEVKRVVPTAERWAILSFNERRKLRVNGMGLYALAARLTIEGDPIGYKKVHLELGRKIYGENKLFNELGDDQFIEEIKRVVPTAEDWAELGANKSKKLNINGMRIKALATRLGVDGNPANSKKVYLELGKKIYGQNKVFEYEEFAELDDDKLIEEIKRVVPTAEDWAELGRNQRLKLKINGMGLDALARGFGVKGGSAKNKRVYYLELGKKIYGENKLFNELGDDQLIEEIKKVMPMAEEWAMLSSNKRSKLMINEIGIKALATRLGVGGNPANSKKVYLELGKKIYGENKVLEYEEFAELDDDKLIEEIKRVVPTAEDWAELGPNQRLKLKINGIGMTALASRFGVAGSPIGRKKVHFELGKKIYGENEVFDKNV